MKAFMFLTGKALAVVDFNHVVVKQFSHALHVVAVISKRVEQ